MWDPLPPPTELTQHSLLYDQSLQISMYSLYQQCKSIAKSENPKFPILRILSKGSMVQKMYDNIASSYPGLQGLSDGSVGEEAAYNAGDTGLIPGWGRSPGGRCGNPLQYSCLENPYGQRNLAGYSPWGHKEWNTTERLRLPLPRCPLVPKGAFSLHHGLR